MNELHVCVCASLFAHLLFCSLSLLRSHGPITVQSLPDASQRAGPLHCVSAFGFSGTRPLGVLGPFGARLFCRLIVLVLGRSGALLFWRRATPVLGRSAQQLCSARGRSGTRRSWGLRYSQPATRRYCALPSSASAIHALGCSARPLCPPLGY